MLPNLYLVFTAKVAQLPSNFPKITKFKDGPNGNYSSNLVSLFAPLE
jgi:hypothetical protein